VTEKRKLIEVALPLEAINRESAREKSIRHGHPSTLHLWWARRPLAACRAILFASYVDDPSAHPDAFPTEDAQQAERERLFKILEDLVKWENTSNEEVLKAGREEIRKSCGDEPPPVYDPFCGGGSIPLEAQRLGLTAYASDLNPVAVLITKALIEIPPKFAERPPVHPDEGKLGGTRSWTGARGLAEDVHYYGMWMRDEAERRIGHLYPKVKLPPEHGSGEATVIAWIWARTVKSPNPAWDGPMPLVRSFVLSKKKGKEIWVQPIVDRENKRIRFDIRTGPDCPQGTVGRSGAVCFATGTPVPLSYIRDEGKAARISYQLMALAVEGPRGRVYLAPTEDQEAIAASAAVPEDLPDTNLPDQALGFRVQGYGLTKHRQLFTNRQLAAMSTFSDLVGDARDRITKDGGSDAYADAIATYLALTVDKLADMACALCAWEPIAQCPRHLFARQAIPMVWDFAEGNPLGNSSGSWRVLLDGQDRAFGSPAFSHGGPPGVVEQLDATSLAPPQPIVWTTDPPYYDNIGYADLSDFFYIWLRRSMKSVYPALFSTLLVPKAQELIADPFRYGGDKREADEHFEHGMADAFVRMRSSQAHGFPLTVIYAFKQAEEGSGSAGLASTGWETMLEGLLAAGLAVNGTWPMRTEAGNRMRNQDSNALASSIALVCRPRPDNAALATRKDFLAALKAELPDALRHLQQGSIAPVDLAQSAIGPGMAVFSRYSKVVEADGSAMPVRTALGLINQVLDETLAEQEADFDGDTRWAVAWFEQFGMNPGAFGVAETLSKAKNTAINGLVAAGILESKAGKVRLLDRAELPDAWDPTADRRLTVWELAQYLIRALEAGGENQAADLLRRIGGLGETARELAYRLYVICERKKWAKEALAYNALVVSWPEISRLAAAAPTPSGPTQQEML
jgi:putative DNA methylase